MGNSTRLFSATSSIHLREPFRTPSAKHTHTYPRSPVLITTDTSVRLAEARCTEREKCLVFVTLGLMTHGNYFPLEPSIEEKNCYESWSRKPSCSKFYLVLVITTLRYMLLLFLCWNKIEKCIRRQKICFEADRMFSGCSNAKIVVTYT